MPGMTFDTRAFFELVDRKGGDTIEEGAEEV